MSDVTTPTTVSDKPVKKAPKPRDPNAPPNVYQKAFTDGKGSVLRMVAVRKKTGYRFFSEHVVRDEAGKVIGKNKGASAVCDTLELAKETVDKAARAAEKLGWKPRVAGGGFNSKPDAFSLADLPKPKGVK